MTRARISLAGRLAILATANVAVTILAVIICEANLVAPWSWITAAALGTLCAFASARSVAQRLRWPLLAVSDGVRGLRDGDFSLRLAIRGNDEVTDLMSLYNDLGDMLRAQRNDIYQKELLLDTILQRTPVGVVLLGAGDRIVYSNAAARELFTGGTRLDGRAFDDVLSQVSQAVRDAITAGDTLFVIGDETFHLTQRLFQLNAQQHRLVLLERLTPELRRQEVSVWKKAIRLVNHELNNSIAPISSLFHSAKLVEKRADRTEKLAEIYDTIEERLAHLRQFLEGYAQFARLPEPRRAPVAWRELLESVHALYDFRLDRADGEALLDSAQMQQALINLVKNAHESGSAPDEIAVSVHQLPDGTLLRVVDRGRGMSDEVMRQALLPFYSTKSGGTGLGLALCNEIVEAHGGRLRLAAREGGGAAVTIWLPA